MASIKRASAVIAQIIHHIEDGLLALLLASMIFLAASQIFLRNFFNSGIEWIDPSLRVLVLWIGLLGAMVAARKVNHINIDVISRLLPQMGRRIVATITNLFSAIICGLVAYHSARFVQMEYDDQMTAFADVPSWACEIIIPIGFALMGIRFFFLAISFAMGNEPAKAVEK